MTNSSLQAAASKFVRFMQDRSGNFAVTAAVVVVPLLLFGGVAMNYSVAYSYRSALQQATDAATLAAALENGPGVTETQRSQSGTSFFKSNFTDIPAEIDFRYEGGTVIGNASYEFDTIFAGLFGEEKLIVSTQAVVGIPEDAKTEMVFALDYSGSMNRNGKYQAMRDAAIAMLGEFKASPTPANIKVGLVPFSEYVLADIDASYIRVVHPSHYGETARACLGTRFAPASTDFSTPDPNDENTKWPTIGLSPYFSQAGGSSGEQQEMLCDTDKKGNQTCEICTTSVDSKGKSKTQCKKVKEAKEAGLRDAGKATKERVQSNFGISDPECQSYLNNGLLTVPMTADHDALIDQLKNAKPVQLTNIALAMDVAAHLISSQAPFTQSKPADKPSRYVVLLTDGEQTVPGYGETGQDNANQKYTIAQADKNTDEICQKLKNDGVTVVTIAFQLGMGKGRQNMLSCASGPQFFFETADPAELANIFREISNLTTRQAYLRK